VNIAKDKFPARFAADVPADQARLMAATQRPITEAALNEAGGRRGLRRTLHGEGTDGVVKNSSLLGSGFPAGHLESPICAMIGLLP
jgi:hypothetical protein